ncbi:MAG: class I SAM-dependent methyltransferase [Burkholderiales bacterium]|nr:class I SAM-dependent methyltransferase [Burkholderiales bacterium]
MSAHEPLEPSPWVLAWAPRIARGTVLDVACGAGRHARLFLARGLRVVAVDRVAQSIPGARFVQADLEAGPWPFAGERFEGIVVTHYLWRPLLPVLAAALAPGGILIYETFMVGHERYGRPSRPEFLLRPGELLDAFKALAVIAFEEGDVASPRPAKIQRLCAARPPEE